MFGKVLALVSLVAAAQANIPVHSHSHSYGHGHAVSSQSIVRHDGHGYVAPYVQGYSGSGHGYSGIGHGYSSIAHGYSSIAHGNSGGAIYGHGHINTVVQTSAPAYHHY